LTEIRANTELPSTREAVRLETADGQALVGELARAENPSGDVLLFLHPLPTHGGFMDSHILRKAANRLPHLTGISVFRFNTRGTESPQGKSTGEFDGGNAEQYDLQAAFEFLKPQFERVWLIGWSFGTELVLKYGWQYEIAGAVLLSPPLHRTSNEELLRWNDVDSPLVALIPEFDDFLTEGPARERFSVIQDIDIQVVEGAKHLWVGETFSREVLNRIVTLIDPSKAPLPTDAS
jgi:alpha/beta superfamily hydrolase